MHPRSRLGPRPSWSVTVFALGWAFACGEVRNEGGGTGSSSAGEGSGTRTEGSGAGSGGEVGSGGEAGDSGGSSTSATSASSGPGSEAGDSGGTRLDVGVPGGESSGESEGGGSCEVVDGMDGAGPGSCVDRAPPDSFEPEIQWALDMPNGEGESAVTPLVANLTDDNGDGKIDLCDKPDLVITATASFGFSDGHLYVVDGETGTVHFRIETPIDPTVTPALGDIDGDGLPEIVAGSVVALGITSSILAFEHDGTLKWNANTTLSYLEAVYGAIALADLDADGDVEIMHVNKVFDHLGVELWTAPTTFFAGAGSAVTAADLDEDGDMEVVLGHAAYHHDGSLYYMAAGIGAGYPQVATLDADPEPEILVTNTTGLSMMEHDGTVKYANLIPTGDPANGGNWIRPATVHDFDGDTISEFAVSSANTYAVYEGDATIVWRAPVSDQSGVAAGTAFDFLGDAGAEAMYADESTFFIFDARGLPYLRVPRSSGTIIEYPVVADVDNDGSSEIVVVSMAGPDGPRTAPTVQVVRDKMDRWIQARRIWNQHTYHVTNVREDGTIPRNEPPSWRSLNTFRTNAQIQGGKVCKPPPVG